MSAPLQKVHIVSTEGIPWVAEIDLPPENTLRDLLAFLVRHMVIMPAGVAEWEFRTADGVALRLEDTLGELAARHRAADGSLEVHLFPRRLAVSAAGAPAPSLDRAAPDGRVQ